MVDSFLLCSFVTPLISILTFVHWPVHDQGSVLALTLTSLWEVAFRNTEEGVYIQTQRRSV